MASQELGFEPAAAAERDGRKLRRKFPETYEAYQRLNPEPDFERLARSLVPGWLDESDTGHPDDAVGRIDAPVLVARGDDDHLTTLADAVELCGRLPKAHFLNIPFAGHVAYQEGRDVFVPSLRRFLAHKSTASPVARSEPMPARAGHAG